MTYRVPISAAALVLAVLAFVLATIHREATPLSPEADRRSEYAAGLGQARVFIPDADGGWHQPVPLYTTKLASLLGSADPVRTATAIVAAIDVALIVLIADVVCANVLLAGAAGLLLAVAPGHVLLARLAAESLFAVPFVLAWCLALVSFMRRQAVTTAVWMGTSLALGVFSAPIGPITMTALAAFSAATMWARPAGRRGIASAALTMALIVGAGTFIGTRLDHAPLVETIGRWWIHPAHIVNPIEGVEAVINRTSLSVRVARYWHVLNPVDLFLPGPAGGSAPLGIGYLVLVLLGMGWWTTQRPADGRLVGLAILLVPIAGVTFEEASIANAAALLPLLVLLAMGGAAHAMGRSPTWSRALALVSALAILSQSAFLLF